MSLVAYERSFKADLLPHEVFKIILSENRDIWVERWTKTFVLGCTWLLWWLISLTHPDVGLFGLKLYKLHSEPEDSWKHSDF